MSSLIWCDARKSSVITSVAPKSLRYFATSKSVGSGLIKRNVLFKSSLYTRAC